MQQTNFKTIILTAGEGCFITQVADVPIEQRIVATSIALGKFDNPENYREIDQTTADEYRAAIKEFNKQQVENERNQSL